MSTNPIADANPTPAKPYPTNAAGRRVCGAQLRNKPGRTCQSTLVMTSGRCRLHGGATPRGKSSANYKTGRWSRDLPTALAARYKTALNDGDMLNLSREVALVDVRLGQVLHKLDAGDTRELWGQARRLMADFRIASNERRTDDALALLSELENVLGRGASDYARWAEVMELTENRRKLVESERKRMVELKQYLSAERAMLMLSNVESTIRMYVKDPNVLAAIGRELGRYVNGPVAPEPDGEQVIDSGDGVSPLPLAEAGARGCEPGDALNG